jgi:DNA-binding NarL/FixJ family response regulator
MIHVAIIDSYPMVVSGTERVLAAEPDIEVVAAGTSVDDILPILAEQPVDVVIVGTIARSSDPLSPLRALWSAIPVAKLQPKLVLLADELDAYTALRAVKLGVRGTVLKHMPTHLLPKCVRKVAAGERWIESESHLRAFDHLLAQVEGPRPNHGMSAREAEILRMVAEGRKNREIATSLAIAEGTVKTHVHNLCAKLNTKTRVGLARFALSNDYI